MDPKDRKLSTRAKAELAKLPPGRTKTVTRTRIDAKGKEHKVEIKRVNIRPVGGPVMSPTQHRRVAAKRIARALRILLSNVDPKQAVQFEDLIPYGDGVVGQFAKDFKLDIPIPKVPSTPGKSEKKEK